MEGFLGALIVAIITTFVQWRIANKDRESREKERKDKFRLAALEKRLEVHQDAYERWNKLKELRFEEDPEKTGFIFECQDWYYKNCLYLDSDSRLEFKKCINNVFSLKNRWDSWQGTTKDSGEYHKANDFLKLIFKQIRNTGNVIARGVDINFKSVKDFDEGTKKMSNLEKELND